MILNTIGRFPVIAILLGLHVLLVTPAKAARVEAAQYTAFWLWGGVPPQLDILPRARSIYFLQGEISPLGHHTDQSVLIAQGVSIPRNLECEIWLVYRANTLNWPPLVREQILARLERWRQAGNRVAGIQIDFDTTVRGLPGYVAALRSLRANLPSSLRLSITGLLDWARNGDVGTITALRDTVDEVVVQTYQGRHTIPNYAAYLERVGRLPLPFKIGLVQNGEWEAVSAIEASPWFRGYVVFFLKR